MGQENRAAPLHVLLCVDDPVDVLVVTELLRVASEAQPLDITQVAAPEELVARYQPRRHDVVLLDLDTAGMAAIGTIGRLLDRDPDVAVVVLVGAQSEAAGEAAVQAGAQDFVTKGGLTGSALRQIVRDAFGRKTALRDLASNPSQDIN